MMVAKLDWYWYPANRNGRKGMACYLWSYFVHHGVVTLSIWSWILHLFSWSVCRGMVWYRLGIVTSKYLVDWEERGRRTESPRFLQVFNTPWIRPIYFVFSRTLCKMQYTLYLWKCRGISIVQYPVYTLYIPYSSYLPDPCIRKYMHTKLANILEPKTGYRCTHAYDTIGNSTFTSQDPGPFVHLDLQRVLVWAN